MLRAGAWVCFDNWCRRQRSIPGCECTQVGVVPVFPSGIVVELSSRKGRRPQDVAVSETIVISRGEVIGH